MKPLLVILSAAVLGGCAAPPPAPSNYANRPPPADPSQWHVVSVTPVAPGTGERMAANSGYDSGDASGYDSSVRYSAAPPSRPVYAPQPVYVAPPVYATPPPYYAPAPSYYPPVSIGLDLMFGRSWGGRHGNRNWGGVGVGIGSR